MSDSPKRYAGLARNIMLAFMAHRLGTTVATQERNHKDYPDESIGEFWFKWGDAIEKEFTSGIDKVMRDAMAKKRDDIQ